MRGSPHCGFGLAIVTMAWVAAGCCGGGHAAERQSLPVIRKAEFKEVEVAPKLTWPFNFEDAAGKRILVSTDSGTFHLYDLKASESGEVGLVLHKTIKLPSANGAAILAMTPDGKSVVGSDKFNLFLWDTKSGQLTDKIATNEIFAEAMEGAGEWVTHLAFRNDTTLAVQSMLQGVSEVSLKNGKFVRPSTKEPKNSDYATVREIRLFESNSGDGAHTINQGVVTHMPADASEPHRVIEQKVTIPMYADFQGKEFTIVGADGSIVRGDAFGSELSARAKFPSMNMRGAAMIQDHVLVWSENEIFHYDGKKVSQIYADVNKDIASLLVLDGQILLSLISGEVLVAEFPGDSSRSVARDSSNK